MALIIDLTPDLERRLADEAARLGQPAELFARAILEERLTPPGGTNRRDGRTPEQILGDYFARCPRASPEDLAVLAREQGIEPVSDFALLRGDRPSGEDEFDVDAFLAARKQWQWEGRPPGVGLADPEDTRQ
jgi:hypothetical protein